MNRQRAHKQQGKQTTGRSSFPPSVFLAFKPEKKFLNATTR